MDFFNRNNENMSLDYYKEILENYNSKFEILFNLKEGMKIGKIDEITPTKPKETPTPKETTPTIETTPTKETTPTIETTKETTKETTAPKKPIKTTKETLKEAPIKTTKETTPIKTTKETPIKTAIKTEEPKETKEKRKLMINGCYCIYENNIYQKISRWWNCENREKTFGYLDKDFTKFVKYLDLIKIEVQSFNSNYYKNLTNDIKKLINKLIPGLYNLKKTYKDEKKIIAKVDSVILILIDFKTEISKKRNNLPIAKSFLLQMSVQEKKYSYYNEV